MIDLKSCKTELRRLVTGRRGLDYVSPEDRHEHERWLDRAAMSGVGAEILEQLDRIRQPVKDPRRAGG